MRDFPGGGVLIRAQAGLLLSRSVDGAVTVERPSAADTGGVTDMRAFPGGGVLIGAENGLFFAVPTPLSLAKVAIRDRENLDESLIDVNRNLSIGFVIAHDCAPVADKLDLKVRVTPLGNDEPNDIGSRQGFGLTYTSCQYSGKFRGLFRALAAEMGTDEASIRTALRDA